LKFKAFVRLFTHIQLLPVLENGEETTLVGGQAVMEGVMMRSPHSYCVAVRKANGEIATQESPLPRLSDRYPIFKLPVIRGLGTLGSAMWLGMRALKFSADCALGEPLGQTTEKKESGSVAMVLQVLFSLVFMLALYKVLPLFLATELGHRFHAVSGRFAINMVDGTLRIAIFLGFMYLLSRLKEMHRVFEYHGAEHKVVFNYESGTPVNIENAQAFTTYHPRCGTSFLMTVMIISMVVYMFIPVTTFWARFAERIILLPLIAGVSYEIIRFAAKHRGSLFALMTAPGLWLQRITTQPPDDSEVECAIIALDAAMALEKQRGGELVIA